MLNGFLGQSLVGFWFFCAVFLHVLTVLLFASRYKHSILFLNNNGVSSHAQGGRGGGDMHVDVVGA